MAGRFSPSPATRRRLVGAVTLAVVLGGVVAPGQAAPPKKKPKLGPNLLPNVGFEASALEGNAAVARGSLAQPVLPTGWFFEGSAGLFDHSPNVYHAGKRSIAISAPASGPRRVCQAGTCQDLTPLNTAKDATAMYYSVTPHWRTLDPIAVAVGQKYRFAVWVDWAIETIGEGASTKVRWLKADGQPLSETTLVVLRATADTSVGLGWKQVQTTVVPPAGAVKAHILLGNTDDLWNSQIRYDDVYFGTDGVGAIPPSPAT